MTNKLAILRKKARIARYWFIMTNKLAILRKKNRLRNINLETTIKSELQDIIPKNYLNLQFWEKKFLLWDKKLQLTSFICTLWQKQKPELDIVVT